MRMKFSSGVLAVAVLLGSACFGGALAQDYPTKPVMLQVPWPAGGSTDVGARIVAAIAEKKLGQPIVVTASSATCRSWTASST